MGVQNFLSVALASAKRRLGPTFSELASYVHIDGRNAKNGQKRMRTQEQSPFSRCYVDLEWFGLTCDYGIDYGTTRALSGGFSSLVSSFSCPLFDFVHERF